MTQKYVLAVDGDKWAYDDLCGSWGFDKDFNEAWVTTEEDRAKRCAEEITRDFPWVKVEVRNVTEAPDKIQSLLLKVIHKTANQQPLVKADQNLLHFWLDRAIEAYNSEG